MMLCALLDTATWSPAHQRSVVTLRALLITNCRSNHWWEETARSDSPWSIGIPTNSRCCFGDAASRPHLVQCCTLQDRPVLVASSSLRMSGRRALRAPSNVYDMASVAPVNGATINTGIPRITLFTAPDVPCLDISRYGTTTTL
eukprot:CAMPEP_0198117764 /NCGR_PEP_ID=MMETSP1442-20131203/19224_1 /TAXON_ID= /ORGANISM="Craspedostauros australis, Strain CCMP3328" /LENGTH=143 /DNA_ID=CAMNT_0043775883 /DNA_START=153 /DNA_END=584 /DNA_ORIENTATION=+